MATIRPLGIKSPFPFAEIGGGDTIPVDVLPPLFVQVTGVSVATGAWSLVSGLYQADISNANILATSNVTVIPDNADHAVAVAAELMPANNSSAGSVRIFAKNLPSGTIGFTLNIENLPQ